MNPRLLPLLISLVLVSFFGHAQQKKQLSQDDYAIWKNVSSFDLSPDGNWLVYELNPQDGDGELIIRNLQTAQQHVIPRGSRPSISPGGGFVAFHIKPQQAVERQAKVKRLRRDQMPMDSLGIFIFNDARLEKYPALQSFSFPVESSDWFTYLIDKARVESKQANDTVKAGEDRVYGADQPARAAAARAAMGGAQAAPGRSLYVYNPLNGSKTEMENVSDNLISRKGDLVAVLTEKKEKDSLSLWEVKMLEIPSLKVSTVDSKRGEMKQLNSDRAAGQLVWMFTSDTVATRTFDIYTYDRRRNRVTQLITAATPGIPQGFGPSDRRRPYFSEDGQRLFIGTTNLPVEEVKDTLLAEERYSLDIWHWEDPLIQPQQKLMAPRERFRSFLAVYHFKNNRLVQLADEEMPDVSTDIQNNSNNMMGSSPIPYLIETTWSASSFRDIYAINALDGSRRLIREKAEATVNLSPSGNYIIWYDSETESWFTYAFANHEVRDITSSIPAVFYNDENDLPRFAPPFGITGWTAGDGFVLINTKNDVWKVDPSGRRMAENLTGGFGEENRLRMRRVNLNPEERFIDLSQPMVFEAMHELTKETGYYKLEGGIMTPLIWGQYFYSDLKKARDADRIMWRQSTYQEYPDIWVGRSDFSAAQKVSNANPQQDEYYWGSVMLVEWKDFDNQSLQGLLYLPEDFDETKQYPMLIYFYEISSAGLYRHFIPSPSRSTINRSYCTSNGYIVFVPDITYKTGFPGESAYNAIVSGTKAMVERYPFIDRHNMGLQGQSWGGYQIAYLITRTNMFKAAMAGAPVSNMVSAYGGIRWESGRSRQFQYEFTQSRIGGTLWEKPFRYIENSPVFFADKIETPLLMMHNDADGAVPWYQGIEMYMAMRRLSKPVWMLVYNDEAHNLTRWPNRMDLSIRMYQFFDHFLKGEPAPVWLKHGLPASEKGKTHAYELTE